MNKILLSIFLWGMMTASCLSQDSVTVYIELPYGPHRTVTFLKDKYETKPTSLPDDFFNTPMGANYKFDDSYQYILELKFPKEDNIIVFKVDNGYSTKTMVGCLSLSKDSAFRLKSFDYVERNSEENSMVVYREAKKLEELGDIKMANKLYYKAANTGNVLAWKRLAENYRNGNGCMRSTKKAYNYYMQAAYMGDRDAYYMIISGGYKRKG